MLISNSKEVMNQIQYKLNLTKMFAERKRCILSSGEFLSRKELNQSIFLESLVETASSILGGGVIQSDDDEKFKVGHFIGCR
jgi:hypothetical protein